MFKLEKTYGTLKVEAKTAGSLFLDGVFQDELPVGSKATLEKVEAGEHELTIQYEIGESGDPDNPVKEVRLVTVERDTVVSISFVYEKPQPDMHYYWETATNATGFI